MPTALDAERAVIGAMLIEPEAYAKVMNILTEDDFYDQKNRAIFIAVRNLVMVDDPVDIITVKKEIEENKLLEGVNVAFLVTSISSEVISSAHIVNHALIVSEMAKKRRTIEVAEAAKKEVLSGKDIGDILQELGYKIEDLARVGVDSQFEHINTYITEAFEEIQAASKSEDGISGIPCGFEDLDRVTSGFQKSDLIILGGRPAMGKTAMLMSMVYNMSVKRQTKTGVFSLEMSGTQLTKRLISLVSEISGEKLRSGQMSPHEYQSLDTSIASIFDSPIYIDDTANINVMSLKSKAKEMVEKHGVEVILIDYIQLVTASVKGNRQEEVSLVSRSLKAIAKELNVPVIALSQVSRKTTDREGIVGKRPQLSDLRESGSIEQDADIVMFIHRPEYYKIMQDEQGNDLRGMAEIIIAKHRNGATGDVRLRFRKELAKFEDLNESIPMPTSMDIPADVVASIKEDLPF